MQDGLAVRRRSDGSIDFDFYRLKAAALRRRAMREALSLRAPEKPEAVAAMLAGVVTIARSIACRFASASGGAAAVSRRNFVGSGPAARKGVDAFARQETAR